MQLTNPAAAQQVQFACDANDDGTVDATESRLCTDAEFDRIAPGEAALTEEQLLTAMEGQKGVPPTFAEIDKNGDDQISRTEWVAAQRFSSAAEAGGGRMSAEEYSKWRMEGMRP